jgi:lipoprotein signal peptidase
MRWLLVIWFGDTAPGRKGRDLALVALPCLLADVVTKCLALGFLKKEGVSFFSGGLTLLFRVNESLFSHGQTPNRVGMTDAMAFWAVMSIGLSAVACFPFAHAQWTVPRKLLVMLAVFFGGGMAGVLLGYRLDWDPPRLVLHAMRAFSATAVLLLGLRLTRSRYLGLVIGLALGGTLGNAINVVYYSRGIIDFIYVPRLSPYLGVFNLADVVLEVTKGLLLLSPLVLVLLRRLGRGNPLRQRRLEYVNSIEPTATNPKLKQG